MLGLPSTTEVGRRLPKEAFYRNLKLDARTRDEFVHLIECITIANSIKPSTVNFADGKRVHEIIALCIQLKSDVQPTRVIEAVAAANPHKLVFRTEPDGVTYVLRRKLYSSNGIDRLTLLGSSLDELWDSACAQVIYGDADGSDLDARIEFERRRAELEAEISKLDTACRKAKQISHKNELFKSLRQKKSELHALRMNNEGR